MKADFPALWAESPSTLRREPTNAELAGGFPCGPLDLPLWNELMFRLAQGYREVSTAITDSGQTPNANILNQLSRAIRRPLSAVDTGPANTVTLSIPNYIHDERQVVVIKVNATNTGATTVTVVGDIPRPLTYPDGAPLIAGELPAGRVVELLTTSAGFTLVTPAIKISTNYYTYLQSVIGTEFFYSNLGAVPDVIQDSSASPDTNTLIGEVNLPAGFINMFATVTVSVGQVAPTSDPVAYQVNLWSSENGAAWQRLEWSDVTKPAGIQTIQLNRSAFRSLNRANPYRIRSTIWKTGGTGAATPPQSSLQVQALKI